ncbi:MAG: hypothetical protein JXR10_00200 [Cyclobacteriaceae bacterium]
MSTNNKITVVLYALLLGVFLLSNGCSAPAQDTSDQEGITQLREYFSQKRYREKYIKIIKTSNAELRESLSEDGTFRDQQEELQEIKAKNWLKDSTVDINQKVGLVYTKSFSRYWKLLEPYRGKPWKAYAEDEVFQTISRGVIEIGKQELSRPNVNGRFHASCFAIPTCAINAYFALFDLMEAVENQSIKDPTLIELNRVLTEVGRQALTQPYRHDETDHNLLSLERFRNHTWWVGGNALAYRSLLPCAAMIRSAEMVEVLAEVASKSISVTSQVTNQSSFWTEGFTADGAGWGHGKQCLIFGYPVDGTSAALSILGYLQGTPWERKLSEENLNSIFNYLKGSSFYVYKGYSQLFLSRGSFEYVIDPSPIKSLLLVKNLLKNWSSSLTEAQIAELKQYQKEAEEYDILMNDYTTNDYSGVKYFYNNDDLIKKTKDYSVYINMGSFRVDGTESAHMMADKLNIFTNDGTLLITKQGREYLDILGGWNSYAVPGITSRHPATALQPILNWRGYCSKYNYAGAATSRSGNAMAGFKFEKFNATAKKGVNDLNGLNDPNTELIFGVRAYKSYFILGDYTVALGSGITNLEADKEGEVFTAINQTKLDGEVYLNGKPITSSQTVALSKDEMTVIEQKDHLSYALLPEYSNREIAIELEVRETDWERHNHTNGKKDDLPTTASVFQLTYGHGQRPVNDTYGYIIYAGDESAEKAFATSPIEVIQNDSIIQAVRSADGTVLGAAFYQSNALLNGTDIQMKTSAPAIILLEKTDDGYDLTVTDPTMNDQLNEIVISTNLPFEQSVQNGDLYDLSVKLPTAEYTGKPISVKLMLP